DLVVFCAADYRPEHCWDIRAATVSQTLATNLAGVYFGLETILPALMARQGGGIALVASVAGYVGLPGACVYGPGKAALINLAELLHAELRQHGIAVYLINPGFVATRLTARNDFTMPALLNTSEAAAHIVRGLERGRFEIHFPVRFTTWIKLLRLLPYRLRLPLLRRLARH
ncbi:SDR family NAD(P)-dependent oxidoreductase, partial [Aquitalea magnusonii]